MCNYPSHREGVVMTCYDCDGRGWMYLDEFLENEGDELLGESPSRYFLRNFGEPFEIGVCPTCEGGRMNIEKFLPYLLVGAIAISVLAAIMVNR